MIARGIGEAGIKARGIAMANRRAVFAFIAMLAFASLAAPAFAQDSALSPDVLNKIMKFIAEKGGHQEIPAVLSSALGLTDSGHTWPTNSIVLAHTVDGHVVPGFKHGFSFSSEGQQDIVIIERDSDQIRAYRTQRDGKLVTAIMYDVKAHQVTVRSRAEAQRGLNTEITYWTDVSLVK
jgi:hypothetical protein